MTEKNKIIILEFIFMDNTNSFFRTAQVTIGKVNLFVVTQPFSLQV